ncbi:Transcription initiation factor TFIID subunit 2-like protein [Drosera capensis]
MRMRFSYNKRKNLAELAAFRECTAVSVMIVPGLGGNSDSLNREIDSGWPGMMTIKVHELYGTHDHLLPMSGDAWQLLEIKCHSRLTTKRFQKPKKSSKPHGSDDSGDAPGQLIFVLESPLLWLRADPLMEYLAEIHFNQPVQMWVLLETWLCLAKLSSRLFVEEIAFLQAFWRVRIEAAFALARAASEAIPQAIATVRTTGNKSPREAVEPVLQLLKVLSGVDSCYD